MFTVGFWCHSSVHWWCLTVCL